jgi:1-deoxy-D-xylulose-5-phosphate synthase
VGRVHPDRAGLVGADGATHHGAYDLAYMRCIPNLIVSAPMNESELRNLMYTATLHEEGPFCIRYPRGEGVLVDWRTPFEEIEIGTGRVIKEGEDVAILTIGPIGNYIKEALQLMNKEISVAHYDMRFVKPLDEKMLHDVFKKFNKIITVEDGCIVGGFGSAIIEFMADHDYQASVRRLGIPDVIIEQGEQIELYTECGYDPDSIAHAIQEICSKKILA